MNNNYIQLSGPLFEQVEMEKIFPDSKYFVDCTPKIDPDTIQREYQKRVTESNFDLKAFVEKHFDPPISFVKKTRKDAPIQIYIETLWKDLRCEFPKEAHSTLIPLPKPHFIPGGRFREVYYWDSYFVALGHTKNPQIIKDIITNFSYLIKRYGFVPNGNRIYYLSRSQPPVFSLLLRLIETIDEKFALSHFESLEIEYQFWMNGENTLTKTGDVQKRVVRINNHLLNRYFDNEDSPRPESYREDVALYSNVISPKNFYRNLRASCESGWDFSSRFLENPTDLSSIETIDIAPIDLNCLLYLSEKTLCDFAKKLNFEKKSTFYKSKYINRKKAIGTLFWNEKKQFYFDYHIKKNCLKNICSLAGMFPLFMQIATKAQAASIAKKIETDFLHQGGAVTTTTISLQQWDSPNGWAPLIWVTYQGLLHYGYKHLAVEIKSRWIKTIETQFAKSGVLFEKYNVISPNELPQKGEYQNQTGFGWTNGIYTAMTEKE